MFKDVSWIHHFINVTKVSLCCSLQFLYTTAGQLVSGFEDTYKKQIMQSYNRVVDTGMYPG